MKFFSITVFMIANLFCISAFGSTAPNKLAKTKGEAESQATAQVAAASCACGRKTGSGYFTIRFEPPVLPPNFYKEFIHTPEAETLQKEIAIKGSQDITYADKGKK